MLFHCAEGPTGAAESRGTQLSISLPPPPPLHHTHSTHSALLCGCPLCSAQPVAEGERSLGDSERAGGGAECERRVCACGWRSVGAETHGRQTYQLVRDS